MMPDVVASPFTSKGPRKRVWISTKAALVVAQAAMTVRLGQRRLMDAILEDAELVKKAAQKAIRPVSTRRRAKSA